MKLGLTKYPACISFAVAGKCVPFNTFLCLTFNILSMSAFLGKNFCTSLPVLIRLSNSWGSLKKCLVWPLVCFWYHTLLKWRIFLKICVQFWANVWYISRNFGYRCSHWFRRGPINWIWVEGKFSSINHFSTGITSQLPRGCKIG